MTDKSSLYDNQSYSFSKDSMIVKQRWSFKTEFFLRKSHYSDVVKQIDNTPLPWRPVEINA